MHIFNKVTLCTLYLVVFDISQALANRDGYARSSCIEDNSCGGSADWLMPMLILLIGLYHLITNPKIFFQFCIIFFTAFLLPLFIVIYFDLGETWLLLFPFILCIYVGIYRLPGLFGWDEKKDEPKHTKSSELITFNPKNMGISQILLDYARGYYQIKDSERKQRNTLLLPQLKSWSASGVNEEELMLCASMIRALLKQNEYSHLLKVIHNYSLKN